MNVDRIASPWGDRTPYDGVWPERVDSFTVETPERWVQSACVLCSTGCGIDIGVKDGRMVGVRGRAADRVNRGRLGPKGLYGWQANGAADRLAVPQVRRAGRLEDASWDDAMGRVVETSRRLIERRTGGAIAFYSSGQLFLEEYYTLALIGKAGIGTPHMDANTRLCTATASAALRESFGSDGQPASFSDLDVADALFLVGHNAASQQTVLWMRILDRLEGSAPPRLVVVDPRRTATAKRATVHLAPRLGTNVALLNGLLHVLIENGWYDADYVEAHAVGFENLVRCVESWTPKRAAAVADVPQARLEEAAEIVGTSRRLVSTVLQGVYQSHQATAAACQVNNIHIVRGMLGKPGCGVFQMNGQPTAQNTREAGADGEFPALLNWENEAHMERLAAIWNVEPDRIPHWAEPTHIMQILRLCELGSIGMLWIIATNPAVSLPDLPYVRKVLGNDDLFVVVQDAFPTETLEFADVVLPAAIWGEKTGSYTNADRTVHVSYQAVDPPGAALADLDIFIEYARRMDFRDKDGGPLVPWTDARGAFEAWRGCSRGRISDYSGLTYEKLGGSGIQWPCNDEHPNGLERLYGDGTFNTAADWCESYGHDLVTGAVITSAKYRIDDPAGRAIIKQAEYEPPEEAPDDAYPFALTTGRVIYHFHTRTKTGRAPELDAAAPEPYVEIHPADAERAGIAGGDRVEIVSRRGRIIVPARVAEDIREGTLFVPFHYGDVHGEDPTAANELTRTAFDPVSKQPYVKHAAVRIAKAGT
jgi:anaerobic selenocysteine-containing dehydrogenase